jgi:hypothetical protein
MTSNKQLDLTEWIARNVIEKRTVPPLSGKGTGTEVTTYEDAGAMYASKILQAVFPDYVTSSNAKVLGEAPTYGAKAEFSVLGNSIYPPIAQRMYLSEANGRQWVTGLNSSDIMETVAVMLHEITHARSPVVPKQENILAGTPSQAALDNLMEEVYKAGTFPSTERGSSGASPLEEFLATALPLTDMKARGLDLEETTGRFGRANQTLKRLNAQFPWLRDYLEIQNQPEKKFMRDSPKVTETPKSLVERVMDLLK